MRTMTADRLSVPGAELYYEVRGRGPALLMIPGGPTDASIFTDLADHLVDRYTVITYDPRGNSRSPLADGPQRLSVEVHADDAARLVAAVDEGPAYVFGSSGGAIYGLDLTAHYTDHVRALVAHEPPLTSLLPDAARWRQLNEDVGAAYVTYGLQAAMDLFTETSGVGTWGYDDGLRPVRESATTTVLDPVDRNMDLFFRVSIPMLYHYVPAIDVLRCGRPRVVCGGGEASGNQLPYRAASALARHLGTALTHFPGDHSGFTTRPATFAERLHEVFVDSEREGRLGPR
jgi:pimeloyl-ACP methyl ester carboxylesterase